VATVGSYLIAADNASGTNKFYVSDTGTGYFTGRLGIGNAGPANTLTVGPTTYVGLDFSAGNASGTFGLGNAGGSVQIYATQRMDFYALYPSYTTATFSIASGTVGINQLVPGATLEVDSSSTTVVTEIVKSKSGQTSDLVEWDTSTGLVLGKVDPNGTLTANNLQVAFNGNVLGTSNTVTTTNAVALGNSHTVSGSNGVAMGYNNSVTGGYAVAIGEWDNATGAYSVALGGWNNVGGSGSITMGDTNTVTGGSYGSVALGYHNYVNSIRAVALGDTNTAGGISYAFGTGNNATGGGAAFGFNSTASGSTAMALGNYAKVTTGTAFAWGDGVQAGNAGSMIIGAGGGTSSLIQNIGGYSLMVSFDTTNAKPAIVAGPAGSGVINHVSLGGPSLPPGGYDATHPIDVVSSARFWGSICVKGIAAACSGNTAGTVYATATTITAADLAENMAVADDELAPGDVVVLDSERDDTYIRSSSAYQSFVIGVVSTKPGVTLGGESKHSRPVALAGRVPVNVTLEGGPIHRGDALVASSTPGKAMRAVDRRRGGVIGMSLTDYNGEPVVAAVAATPADDDGVARANGHQVLMFVGHHGRVRQPASQ
jgi:hypothetical protein